MKLKLLQVESNNKKLITYCDIEVKHSKRPNENYNLQIIIYQSDPFFLNAE